MNIPIENVQAQLNKHTPEEWELMARKMWEKALVGGKNGENAVVVGIVLQTLLADMPPSEEADLFSSHILRNIITVLKDRGIEVTL